MEPLSCVLHGVQRADIALADQVAILGAGPIGILMLQAARLQGAARITVVEHNPGRADLARQLEADRVLNSLGDLPRDTFDVVIEATGVIPLMQRSPDFARHGGTVLLFGVPPAGQRMELDAFQIFRKGLAIVSSFTSRRNSYQAVNLLASGQIQVEPLISHLMPLQEFPQALELLEQKRPEVRKVMILPNG
jgi:threonine dehydrogenase-like Zn-dependent dehydrogenase